jgi:hypothetical protein
MKLVQKKVTKPLRKHHSKDIISLEKRLNGNLTEVLGWLVEKKSCGSIQELLKEKFEIDVSRTCVWRFSQSPKWKPIVARGRIELAKHITRIPCANKEIRLLYHQKVIEEGLKWCLKSYDKAGNPIYELKLSAVTEAIKAAKEEVEGKIPLIDSSTHYHFTNLQGEKLVAEARRRGIPIPDAVARRFGDTREIK